MKMIKETEVSVTIHAKATFERVDEPAWDENIDKLSERMKDGLEVHVSSIVRAFLGAEVSRYEGMPFPEIDVSATVEVDDV